MANNNTPKKGTSLAVIAIIITVLLVAIPIIVFSIKGPVEQVKAAANSTLLADNFTLKFSTDINCEKAEGTVTAAIDMPKKQLNLNVQLYCFTADYQCGIYDNTFVIFNTGTGRVQSQDVTDRVQNFFALLDQEAVPDWSVLLDFEDLDLQEEIARDFDFEIFMACLGQWLNQMNKGSWAEENAGYTKDSEAGVITHTFQPDLHTLASQTAPLFEKAFKDPQRYQALLNYLDDAKYLLKDSVANLSFRVQNNYLTAADFTLRYHNTEIRCNLTFSEFGTTSVDMATIASLIQQAKEEG